MTRQAVAMCLTQIRRDDQIGQWPAEHVALAIAERPLRSRIELDDATVTVHGNDAVERRFHDCPVSSIALAQRRFRALRVL